MNIKEIIDILKTQWMIGQLGYQQYKSGEALLLSLQAPTPAPSGEACLCSEKELSDRYYPCRCLDCGYEACSSEWNSEPIGMTGDYSVTCPKCHSENYDEISTGTASRPEAT